MTDGIDGIFDHITPDDFARETSALETIERAGIGATAFNAFVDEQVRGIRTSYIASSGNVDPIAIIVSPTIQRVFAADDDESLNDFVARIHREAKQIGAIWTFVGKKTLVGTKLTSGPLPDLNDPEAVDDALAEGILSVGMMWYADRREGELREHRTGSMPEVAKGRLGEGVVNDQGVPIFATILDD